ncbi:hypothetical protein M422DRAFT_245515 [Sphaerobolus stellatus SS14]|nr:hypothetical protein M422DRAFT_245515 [Sphaerobolus stellatus SS14]
MYVDTIAEVDVVARTRGGLIWKTSPVPANPEKFKATWLGHACFLVELPTPSGAARGPRILYDPVFSLRCGPTSCLGPGRITLPACPIQQLTEVDTIVISVHPQHMRSRPLANDPTSLALLDIPTIRSVIFPPSKPTSIAPLKNEYLFQSLSIPSSNYYCLDWWHNHDITVQLPAAPSSSEPESTVSTTPLMVSTTFRLHCTPPNTGVNATSLTDGQHYGARGPSNPILSTQRPHSQ